MTRALFNKDVVLGVEITEGGILTTLTYVWQHFKISIHGCLDDFPNQTVNNLEFCDKDDTFRRKNI